MIHRRAWALIGLAALLVVDVILVTWALRPGVASSGTADGRAVITPSPSLSSGRAQGPTSEPVDAEVADPAPLTRSVVAVDATTAWLVEAGSCGEPGTIHVTSTGGDEWASHQAPGSVTRVRPTDASAAFVVGGDGDCESRLWYTSDGGAVWGDPQPTNNAWGRHPGDAQLVLRPGGDPVDPCNEDSVVLDLVGLSGGAAAALCDDGSLRTTSDSGRSWTTDVSRPGLHAIALLEPGRGAVAGVEEGCDGVVVTTLQAGELGEGVCVDALPVAGQVALSLTEDSVWLVAGESVMRSESVNGSFEVVSAWPAP